MTRHPRTLSSLAASILMPTLLGPSAAEPEADVTKAGPTDEVRRTGGGPRRTEDASTTQFHRPLGHGV